MSKSFTFNQMFLELIDNILNCRHRFENREIGREELLRDIRVGYLETIAAFAEENNIKLISPWEEKND